MSAELSGLVIARNEAVDLPRCLQLLREVCSDIVVVDNESTDATPEIARAFGSKVITTVMNGAEGFAGLRNTGLELVETSHVLILDADERPTHTLLTSVKQVMEEERTNAAYRVSRRNNAFGGWLDHGRFGADRQIRLLSSNVRYTGVVHETPVLEAGTEIIDIEGNLEHFTYKTLGEYLAKMRNYAEKQAQTQAIPPTLKHMLGIPAYNLIARKGYKDGWRGIAMAIGDGWHDHLLRKFTQRAVTQTSAESHSSADVLTAVEA